MNTDAMKKRLTFTKLRQLRFGQINFDGHRVIFGFANAGQNIGNVFFGKIKNGREQIERALWIFDFVRAEHSGKYWLIVSENHAITIVNITATGRRRDELDAIIIGLGSVLIMSIHLQITVPRN